MKLFWNKKSDSNENAVEELRATIEQQQGTIERQSALVSSLFSVVKQSSENPGAHRFDNPWLYASPHSTKRHPESLAPLETLRQFANNYDILRSCINHLKREVQAVPYEIVSRDPKVNKDAQIKDAKKFFARWGGLGGVSIRTRHFENQIVEDVLVTGAYAVYINKARNGKPYEAVAIDSATIRPVVDLFGWQDPASAYEQQIQGVPIRRFAADELYYDGLDSVTHSPYFKSPVEYLLSVILSALKADEWNRTWLTDGNVPDRLIGVPESWTPDQVLMYAEYFDAILSGNVSERVKAKIVPGGVRSVDIQSRKDADFQEFERWLMMRTCSIMGVQPASIGFAGEQYKVSQENSMKSTTQYGAGALLQLRKELYEDILESLGFAELEIKNMPQGEEDPNVKAERLNQECGGPYKTINEARAESGLDPVEGGDFIRDVKEQSVDPDQTEQPNESKETDLKKWERKALARLSKGKSPSCEFLSDFISDRESALIARRLQDCSSREDVASVFLSLQNEETNHEKN